MRQRRTRFPWRISQFPKNTTSPKPGDDVTDRTLTDIIQDCARENAPGCSEVLDLVGTDGHTLQLFLFLTVIDCDAEKIAEHFAKALAYAVCDGHIPPGPKDWSLPAAENSPQ
jgi:hypothetical protein